MGRIHDRTTFAAMRTRGHRARRGPISVTFLPDGSPVPRVAYAVGRRVGGAVVRNRVRRRLRAAVADLAGEGPGRIGPGAYLVVAGPSAPSVPYQELKQMLATALSASQAQARP